MESVERALAIRRTTSLDQLDWDLAAEAIDPARAVFVEDMAINLEPAAALGLTTVWLRTEADWATAGADAAHVHHRAEDLVSFLDDLKRHTDAA